MANRQLLQKLQRSLACFVDTLSAAAPHINILSSVLCPRAPTKSVLYINDGSGPCDEAAWRQLPPPAAQGPGAAHTFDSTPAFVYAHNFVGSDQVCGHMCDDKLLCGARGELRDAETRGSSVDCSWVGQSACLYTVALLTRHMCTPSCVQGLTD